MKSLTVGEAGGRLAELVALAHRGEPILLRDGGKLVVLERFDPLPPSPVADPEQDSPELEAELLQGVRSPHSDYSRAELEESLARIVHEETSAGR